MQGVTSNSVHVSIVVPVYNDPRDLYECLSALIAASSPEAEIIVVDDASTDATPSVATRMGVRVLRLAKNSGPGAARNCGARHAQGELLFFVDADVVVAPEAVSRVVQVFAEHPEVAAVFGSYDARPRVEGVVSQYRNLLHHFVHQHGNPEASTFWAGCGAIRRSVFEEVGGFDETFTPPCSVDDIELGYRIRQAGHRIRLDKALQGTHLKRWTLRSVILTDITHRAVPWSRLILETKDTPNDLNLKGGQRLSAALVMLACLLLPLAALRVELLALSAVALLGVVILNRDLYAFFFRQRGLLFAGTCIPLHLLYYLYGGLSYLYVWIGFQLRPTSRFRTDTGMYLVLFVLVMVVWLPRFSGPIDLRWDGSVYYILGTSLAEGKGYRLLNEPGEIEAVQYPPLLPLIVAAHQWVLGTSAPTIVGHWLRLSFFLVFTVYVFTIYLLLRHYLPLQYALFGTLVCLFNLYTYFLSDVLFPEILYGLATTAFVLFHTNHRRPIYPIVATLLALASYTLRTLGIALLAAWVAESLLNREFKRAAVRLALALVPIVCWQSYIASVESGPRYTNPVYEYQRADYLFYNVSYAKNIFRLKDPFSPELGSASFADIAERFLRNLTAIPTSLGETVSTKKRLWEEEWAEFNKRSPFPLVAPWPMYLVLILLGGLILGGMSCQLARRQWLIPVYILLSVAAMCLTPWPGQFNRYLMPLAPFVALSFCGMLCMLQSQSDKILPARWQVASSVFTGSIVLLIFVQQSLTFVLMYTKWPQKVVYEDQNSKKIGYRLFFYHDSYRVLDAGLDWLKARTKPGDVVAGSMPHWVYLRTGLKAVMPPFESDPVKAQKLLDSVPVSYLILDEGLAVHTRKYTAPVVQHFPDRWQRLYAASILTESGEEFKDSFEIYQRVEPQIPSARREAKGTDRDSAEAGVLERYSHYE